jgi:hypothetical protein
MKFRLIMCFVFAFASTRAFSSVYYVSTAGNDGNAGTEAQPWRTIAKANRTLAAGDVVYVKAGRYHEKIAPAQSGTSDAPIGYYRYANDQVIIDGTGGSLEVVGVGSSYVVLDGLQIENQAYLTILNQPDYWVRLSGNYITLRNCHIMAFGDTYSHVNDLHAYSRGVVVFGQHATIEHCYVRGQQMGVVLAGNAPRYATLRFDTLVAQEQSNIDITSPEDGGSQLQGNLIEYCVLDTSFEEDNVQFEPNYQDHTVPINRGTIIRHCRIGNAAENCLDFKGAANILIEGNLLYGASGDNDGPVDGADDSGGSGFELGAGDVTRYVIVRENVIWDNHTGAKAYDGYRYYNNVFLNNRKSYRGSNGNYAGNDFSGLCIWNIVANRRAVINNIIAGQPNAGVLSCRFDWGAKFLIDNNLYYQENGPAVFQHRMNGSVLITSSLASWQNILATAPDYAYLEGKDAHSVEADPGFLNGPSTPVGYETTWNFNLNAISPALQAGRCATEATNAGTLSTTLTVGDPYFFTNGYGATGGDTIRIGGGEPVSILAIDYSTGTITLDDPRTWRAGDGVHTWYEGSSPNIGLNNITATPQKMAPPKNLLTNPGFEDGTTGWTLGSSGEADFTVTGACTEGTHAAKVHVTQAGTSMQVYQAGLILQPHTQYRIRFAGKASKTAVVQISMFQTVSPYASYGLSGYAVGIDTGWNATAIDFVTKNISAVVSDARLRIGLPSGVEAGDDFSFDDVSLVKVVSLSETAVEPETPPPSFHLQQNYPNPFNPTTKIGYGVVNSPSTMVNQGAGAGWVRLTVYDLLGREVAVLVNEEKQPGFYEVTFDAGRLASGVYLYRLVAGTAVETHKMIVLK